MFEVCLYAYKDSLKCFMIDVILTFFLIMFLLERYHEILIMVDSSLKKEKSRSNFLNYHSIKFGYEIYQIWLWKAYRHYKNVCKSTTNMHLKYIYIFCFWMHVAASFPTGISLRRSRSKGNDILIFHSSSAFFAIIVIHDAVHSAGLWCFRLISWFGSHLLQSSQCE